MSKIKCPCGNEIEVKDWLIGRKKYCSKKCFYRFRTRPNGLSYKIVVQNGGWFKKGQKTWSSGKAGRGILKANSGSIKKGQHLSPRTEITREQVLGPKNILWKGDSVGYHALHKWVGRTLGRAVKCSFCGKQKGRIEWANKSHEYKRKSSDWIQLCKKCHFNYDKDTWGLATKKFKL